MPNTPAYDPNCLFCKIIHGGVKSARVYENKWALAFLDHRPVFPGHCLLVTTSHFGTLADVPLEQLGPVFAAVQLLTRAVMEATASEGTFVAVNNRVSQSVPHFHVHIVPRRKGDGLKGFFWPRHPYKNADEVARMRTAIEAAALRLDPASPR